MKKMTFMWIIFLFVFISSAVLAQFGRKYKGPDDPAGDLAAVREGYMTGNRVFILFKNQTELSDWPHANPSRWPNTYYGERMTDGIGLLVSTRVYIKQDSIPMEDISEIDSSALGEEIEVLYYCQTNYRQGVDYDATGRLVWGFYPPFGYFNRYSETPAMSNDPFSWPPEGWPSRGRERHWAGEWDGRFGRGVIYADLETYFVANDAQDQEYLGTDDRVKYYPRPGVKIGDIMPEVTVQRGMPWGGIGVRVEQRGFQWNNPQARDAIFWEYTIANISDYDLPEVSFGYWVDNQIGNDGDDDIGGFDKYQDLSYSWDYQGIGTGGTPTGTMGFAFLESPGIATDGIDNDDDGLVDEQRDNPATMLVDPYYHIQGNVQKFLDFYGYKESELREHWDADEDQDWDDGFDTNENNIYDIEEYAADDVGLDGVGPGELNYYGPDADGSECNHMPDFVEGEGCEPDFGWLDISESDMLGLTSFRLIHHPPPSEDHWNPSGDRSMWELVGQDSLVEYFGELANLVEVFASSSFPLYQGRTERISMAELHSYDPITGLNSPDHSAPALFNLKKVVQVIYEKDYRFAQPPKMPTLTATPGDDYVVLSWDNIADTRTREPFLRGVNDFEGFKIFRATDAKMSDPEVITDGYGTPMFKKPIFICDLKDGKRGFTDYGLQNGMGYYLGEDTGITHSFIDRSIQNGRTYYYAIVAYDYGIHPDSLKWKGTISAISEERFGIAPSENNVVIELDEAEDIRFIGRNVAIITPGPQPAGFQFEVASDINYNNAIGKGQITVEPVLHNSLKNNHTYAIKFSEHVIDEILRFDPGYRYTTNGIYVYDVTDGNNILVYEDIVEEGEDEKEVTNNFNTVLMYNDDLEAWHIYNQGEAVTGLFDGLQLRINAPVITAEYDSINSGWLTGNAPMNITHTDKTLYMPYDFDIVFTDNDTAFTSAITSENLRLNIVRNEVGERQRDNILVIGSTSFYVRNNSLIDTTTEDYVKYEMVVQDMNENGVFDILGDRIFVGPLDYRGRWAATAFILDFYNALDENELPKPGDVYRITFNRPFTKSDSLTFTVQVNESADVEDVAESMSDIDVVPNPYVATNVMEPSVANPNFNQRRRLMFVNIPEECTIKIFTMSGYVVDEIHAPDDGLVSFNDFGKSTGGFIHWDMLSREGLEIAAGVYIYHVRDEVTGKEKLGKFAVIK